MDRAQSDLVVWYKLETEFFQDYVRHTRYLEKAKKRNEKVEEDWSNCGELGRGGFGVVHKQIRKDTGHYRAVKTIDKRLPAKLDYSRELLVMAILAKHPPLFVEFLGWFEEPETLYIAMEYFKEGDLSRHTCAPLPQETVKNISKQILEGLKVMHQHGIAHRDLKPANIFVVSMSPVWVKLGDFGVSKRIRAQATTTFHTQVLTQVYSAPEVLGLDSNSETSDYTNSVDIWSLGCVIYELLVGKQFFVSEAQVSRYFFGKKPFPEDKLEGLSPPTDNLGISLLKSMLVIQPEDRPTAAGALSHGWLTGLRTGNEHSVGGQDETTQSRGETTPGRKRKIGLATQNRMKKRRSRRNPIALDSTKCIPVGVASEASAGSQCGGDPSALGEPVANTYVTTPSDAASLRSSVVQAGPRKPKLVPHNSQAAHSIGLRAPRKKKIRNISHTLPENHLQAIPRRQTFVVEIISHPPRRQTGATEHTPQSTRKFRNSTPDETVARITIGEPTLPCITDPCKTVPKIQSTKRNTRGAGDGRNKNVPTMNSIQSQNTTRSPSTENDPYTRQTPIAGRNPS
ncbi:kinase-like domain-containing protein [Tuber borchii]|uniref:Kinase-like domain-containing protein n=1 Tax=Tuber borchii TaxID=42251 RepID=A0A2T6ZVX0_TUBBO|nr:kinase-like domain-containing protein [Tuber borchii]